MKAFRSWPIILIILLTSLARAQWTEPVRISSDPHLGQPRVAVVGDTLHVSAKAGTKLYYLRSFDNGETWTGPICPVDTFYRSYLNDIVYSNGRICLAFIGRVHTQEPLKLFTVSSQDHGLTWEEPIEVYYNGWKYPRLAASGDTLFLSSVIPGRILFYRSLDNGESWSDAIIADSGSISMDYPPNILYSQERIHLVYQLSVGGDTVGIEIYYCYSDDNGETWSERQFLSTPEGVPYHEHSQGPSAFADSSGNIIALWFDYKYGSECGFTGDILGRVSRDNGETWLPETRLTYSQTGSSSTCLVLEDTLYAIWLDEEFLGCGYPKLMYSSSSDWGRTWEEPEIIYRSDELIEYGPVLFYNYQEQEPVLHCITGAKHPGDPGDLYYMNRNIPTRILEDNTNLIPNMLILEAYPNPFNSNIMLTLNGSKGGDNTIAVYDIQGRLIKRLELENKGGNKNNAVWDATDNTGRRVSSGVYFARARAGRYNTAIKMLYLK